jgi:hypothetical protein
MAYLLALDLFGSTFKILGQYRLGKARNTDNPMEETIEMLVSTSLTATLRRAFEKVYPLP